MDEAIEAVGFVEFHDLEPRRARVAFSPDLIV
jgi:hypothetical protein